MSPGLLSTVLRPYELLRATPFLHLLLDSGIIQQTLGLSDSESSPVVNSQDRLYSGGAAKHTRQFSQRYLAVKNINLSGLSKGGVTSELRFKIMSSHLEC